MKNAVGRDIPEALLVNGKEVYQGKNYMDGKYLQKAAPCTRRYERPQESKIVETLADALRQCGAKDGMTFSFHHHLRNGDYVVNMVMKAAIEELGLKDLTIAATSLGEAHDPIAEYIEAGKVVGIQTSGIREMCIRDRPKASTCSKSRIPPAPTRTPRWLAATATCTSAAGMISPVWLSPVTSCRFWRCARSA